jgi:hypothetical protein
MRESATRYLVVSSLDGTVLGFVTWQIDTEEDDIVIYWYYPQDTYHLYPHNSLACIHVPELTVVLNYNYLQKFKDLV